jgi:hypothetical protein
MAEKFQDVIEELGDAIKKPQTSKTEAVLAVQIVDKRGKIIDDLGGATDGKGAASAESRREKEKRENKDSKNLKKIADILSKWKGMGGAGGADGGKGFGLSSILGAVLGLGLLKTLMKAIGMFILRATGLAFGFKLLGKGWKAVKAKVGSGLTSAGKWLKTLGQNIMTSIKGFISKAWGIGKKGVMKAIDMGKKFVTGIKDIVVNASKRISSTLRSKWGLAKEAGKKGVMKAIDMGKKFVTGIKDIAKNASERISSTLRSKWGLVKEAGKKGALKAIDMGKKFATGIKDIAVNASNRVGGALKSAWTPVAKIKDWGLNKIVNLKNIAIKGAGVVAGAIQGVLPKITGIAKTATKGGAVKAAVKLGAVMLLGAKLIPGAGLAVMGAVALYDGLTAGMESFKKSGALGKAIKDGTAGALSGITFGLVSQKTFADAFDTISDKYTSLTTDVSKLATKAWMAVKDKLPTKDQIEKTFNSLAKGFTNITGITVPTFSDIETKINNIGDKLKASFDGIVNKANNFFTKTTDWFTGLFDIKPPSPAELEAIGGKKFATLAAAEAAEEISPAERKQIKAYRSARRKFDRHFGGGDQEAFAKFLQGKGKRGFNIVAGRAQRADISESEIKKLHELNIKYNEAALKKKSLFTRDEELYERLDKIFPTTDSGRRAAAMLQAGIQRGMGGPGGGGGITSINTGGNVVNAPTTTYVNNGTAARRPIILNASVHG